MKTEEEIKERIEDIKKQFQEQKQEISTPMKSLINGLLWVLENNKK